jgi:two-component system chemotaxis response regulator CheY
MASATDKSIYGHGRRNLHRILIADDHAAVRTALRSLFDRSGFEVCGEAVNGVEAIEKAEEFRPDLIVLDFCMPVMDGLEASRQIANLMPDVPLMMFTSHVSKVMEEDARKAGIRRIIAKGESIQKLLDDARELLGLNRAGRTTLETQHHTRGVRAV